MLSSSASRLILKKLNVKNPMTNKNAIIRSRFLVLFGLLSPTRFVNDLDFPSPKLNRDNEFGRTNNLERSAALLFMVDIDVEDVD